MPVSHLRFYRAKFLFSDQDALHAGMVVPASVGIAGLFTKTAHPDSIF